MIEKTLLNALNVQIRHELESSYIYLSMVSYFHSINMDGMAHWMRCQSHEEMIHAMKFFFKYELSKTTYLAEVLMNEESLTIKDAEKKVFV